MLRARRQAACIVALPQASSLRRRVETSRPSSCHPRALCPGPRSKRSRASPCARRCAAQDRSVSCAGRWVPGTRPGMTLERVATGAAAHTPTRKPRDDVGIGLRPTTMSYVTPGLVPGAQVERSLRKLVSTEHETAASHGADCRVPGTSPGMTLNEGHSSSPSLRRVHRRVFQPLTLRRPRNSADVTVSSGMMSPSATP